MARKVAALEALQPDVAVLCEATQPEHESAQRLWFPSGSRLGIQVMAFGDHRLRPLKRADAGGRSTTCRTHPCPVPCSAGSCRPTVAPSSSRQVERNEPASGMRTLAGFLAVNKPGSVDTFG